MKKLLLALALCLLPSLAMAQCNGNFSADSVCGSLLGGAPGPVAFTSFARPKIPATTFYVDDINGNDSNACTSATTGACKTLNGAVAVIGSYDLNFQGITVNVAAPGFQLRGYAMSTTVGWLWQCAVCRQYDDADERAGGWRIELGIRYQERLLDPIAGFQHFIDGRQLGASYSWRAHHDVRNGLRCCCLRHNGCLFNTSFIR